MENALAEVVREVGRGTVGGGLEEVEATKEAEPIVIAQSRRKLAVGTDLTQVD